MAFLPVKKLRFQEIAASFFTIGTCLTIPAIAHSGKPSFSAEMIARRQSPAGYDYQNGGFTFNEQRAMTRAAHDFNLRLTFVTRAGSLAVPEFLVIGTHHDGAMEKIALTAPWFQIRLPPGAYTVLARFKRGVILIRDIDLAKGQSRAVRVRAD